MTEKPSKYPNDLLRQERIVRGWTQKDVAGKIGTDGYTINRWERGRSRPSPYFRQKLMELFGKDVRALGLLDEEHDTLENLKTPTIWNVPYRQNLYFTGREDIIERLHIQLQDIQTAIVIQTQAICGLGGIGKTQVAVEYAYRYRNHYDAVLWVQAGTPASFQASFLALASLLDLPEKHLQEVKVINEAVKRWLQENQDWLLIVDNVENLQMVSDFIPSLQNGHILMTTRAASSGAVAHRVELEEMNSQDGALLLLRRSQIISITASLDQSPPAERQAAQQLSTILGGLPLALDQAAAYIEKTGCGVIGYFSRYQNYHNRLNHLSSSNQDYPASVATTLSLSFKKVYQSNPVAAEILQICSLLHSGAIPEELFRIGASDFGMAFAEIASDELYFDAAISELRNYSFVRRYPEAQTLGLHPLVQTVVRDNMQRERQSQLAERLIKALNRCFPVQQVEFSDWEQCQRYLPHVFECAQHISDHDLCISEAPQLLQRAGLYLQERGFYQQAERLLQQALTLQIRLFGEEHLDVAEGLNCLASVYEMLWKDPEPLFLRALDIRTRLLGTQHYEVGATLNNLALFYQKIGRYADAEPLYLRAVDILEQILGADHLDVASAISNLGAIYSEVGKYSQSEALYRRAIAIRENALGCNHPLVAISIRLLGLLCTELARYTEAEILLRKALSIREQALGVEHPYVATLYHDLAELYVHLGRHADAESFYQRAFMIRERVFGSQNPYVARTLIGLAELYCRQNRYIESERMFLRAISILEPLFKFNHSDVAMTHNGMAELYCKQGNYTLALHYGKSALRGYKSCYGKKHLLVAKSMNTLASVYRGQNHYRPAERLYQQALVMAEHIVGPKHPSTVRSLSGLAELYLSNQQFEAAKSLHQRILCICDEFASEGYPDLANQIEQYAILTQTLNELPPI